MIPLKLMECSETFLILVALGIVAYVVGRVSDARKRIADLESTLQEQQIRLAGLTSHVAALSAALRRSTEALSASPDLSPAPPPPATTVKTAVPVPVTSVRIAEDLAAGPVTSVMSSE